MHYGYRVTQVGVTESGLKFSFDVKTTLIISDIVFYPSRTTHGYDLYASAADKEDILFLNLSNGEFYQNFFCTVVTECVKKVFSRMYNVHVYFI